MQGSFRVLCHTEFRTDRIVAIVASMISISIDSNRLLIDLLSLRLASETGRIVCNRHLQMIDVERIESFAIVVFMIDVR
jgi:hypothetical protein